MNEIFDFIDNNEKGIMKVIGFDNEKEYNVLLKKLFDLKKEKILYFLKIEYPFPLMKTHPPIVFTLYGVKTLEVGVSARVTLNSHSINRLTPCFPRFVLYYRVTRDSVHL